jgi:hypothetical protein
MSDDVFNELYICDRCGAVLGMGKYRPLSKQGKNASECTADMRRVPNDEADRLIAALAAEGQAE